MKYDIQKNVDYILNADKPSSLRAIRFFTLLVALHAGSSRAAVTGRSATTKESSLFISVPRKVLRDARLLAAMKFLDHIETEWRESNPGEPVTLAAMTASAEYSEIFNSVIVKQGGWNKIRYSSGIRQLEEDLQDWKGKARDVARIIEFSVRHQPSPRKPRQVGGVTMAIDIVISRPGKKYFRTKRGKTQLEVFWSQLKSAAPFHYLLYIQKFKFYLKLIAGKSFATKWRTRVEDREALLQFFAAYNQVTQRLVPRQYRYTQLNTPHPAKPSELAFDPIQPTGNEHAKSVLTEIAGYTRA